MLDNYFITSDRCHIIGINGGCGVTCEAYLDGECPEPTGIVLEGEQGYDRHIELYPTLGDMTMNDTETRKIIGAVLDAKFPGKVRDEQLFMLYNITERVSIQAATIRKLEAELSATKCAIRDRDERVERMGRESSDRAELRIELQKELEAEKAAHENSAKWNRDLRERNQDLCIKLTAAKENALLIEEQERTILRLSAGMDELNATKRETTIRDEDEIERLRTRVNNLVIEFNNKTEESKDIFNRNIEMGEEIVEKNRTIKQQEKRMDRVQGLLHSLRMAYHRQENAMNEALEDYIPF